MHDISFGGRSLLSIANAAGMKVLITQHDTRNIPMRKMDVFNVPGRSGDIVIPQNAYENVSVTYEIIVGDGVHGHSSQAAQVIYQWLVDPYEYEQRGKSEERLKTMQDGGYYVLQDTFDVGHKRLAYVADTVTVQDRGRKYATAQVTFSCKPNRFVNQDTDWILFNTAGNITNSCGVTAYPLFKYVNTIMEDTYYKWGASWTRPGTPSQVWYSQYRMNHSDLSALNGIYYLDTYYKKIFNSSFEDVSDKLSVTYWPILENNTTIAFDNEESYGGGLVYILPRWWTL